MSHKDSQVQGAAQSCGCSCSCSQSPSACTDERPAWKMYLPVLVSSLLFVTGLLLDYLWKPDFFTGNIRLIGYIVAYLPVGLPVLKESCEAFARKDFFTEFSLMSIATIGAFFIGEYPEGVAVMLFYAIGELFQEHAVNRAKKNISALLDVRPESATVIRTESSLREGAFVAVASQSESHTNEARTTEAFVAETRVTVSPESVRVGETVEVKPGERVPLDGTLQTQSASFNTSALTGESVPRTLHEGEEVLAGMIATDTVARITVSKPFGQSALARILELVQNATERKAPTEQFIRKFARVYTPIMVGLAVSIVLLPWIYSLAASSFVYDFNDWLYRALVFLVISCPCALVISIPLGYFGGIGAASRNGILFKGSNYLDAITRINSVVMDKTGTLTQGVFDVQQIVPANGVCSESELLETIASVESQSTHPIAKAIVAHARKQALHPLPPEKVKEIAGHGLEAIINGKTVLAGNAKLLDKYHIAFPAETLSIPETIVLCAIDGRYAGYILVADAPKEDAHAAIESLQRMGIKNIVMLSGDKQAIVSKLAASLNITQAYGDLLPEGKVQHIEQLKADPANKIAFVGDGINDAPVLAMSDIGMAMGALGSDVAIETADVIIQTDQPSKIATAIRIGKATRRIVMQNIALAFGVKLLVLLLGAGGIATLWEAVFADVGVALLAILNAVRILKMKFG